METIIERAGRVSNDPLNVGLIGLDKIHSGHAVNWLSVFINQKVEGNAMFSKVLDVDQWGEDVLAILIID